MKTKVCTGYCGEDLPLSEFGPHPATADRLHNACRNCKAEYQARHRAGVIERSFEQSSYLERHQERRAEEAANCLSQAGPADSEAVDFIKTEKSFAGLIDSFFRQRQKISTWKAI